MNPPSATTGPETDPPANKLAALKASLIDLARARGFDALGVSDVALDVDAAHLEAWLG